MYDLGFLPKGSLLKKLLWFKAVALSAASAIIKTVTGTAPITLSNAISHAILSLTQGGKCAQSGTPAQNNYVPIMCNNGELRMVDDELPSGFKRVLGFGCNNNAMWQIAGFKLRGSDTVKISFSVTAACNVWGCYQSTSATDNYDLYVTTTSGGKYLRYANGTYASYFSTENQGKRFDVTYTPTGTQGMPEDSTWTEATFESANDLLIGSTTVGGTSAKLKGNLYEDFIVENGGVERLHLVPCERVSDSVLGYYDLVGETFYEPYEGYDDAVSLGYDGSHYVLSTVGTPEVLTVSASGAADQTAAVANLLSLPGGRKDYQEIISGVVTRKCRIIVFDGTEDWKTSNNKPGAQWLEIPNNGVKLPNAIPLCTRFKQGHGSWGTLAEGECLFEGQGSTHWDIDVFSGLTDNDAFKSMLEGWYAAGEPLMMVIPAAETTEQVTPQPLSTNKGMNTASVTAEVSGITLAAEYKGTA